MSLHVCLLRGINVGGHRKVPMAELRTALTEAGLANPTTYVQSGNVVFGSSKSPGALTKIVRDLIEKKFGFEVEVVVYRAKDFAKVADSNSLIGKRGIEESFLHVVFPMAEPAHEIPEGEVPARGEEQVVFHEGHYYLYCPDGYGKSKLSNPFFERKLGVPTTTRNWRTVGKILELCE